MAEYLVTETGCWQWQGPDLRGYPMLNGKRAHRVYYEHRNGSIGDLHLHHACGNVGCVNPDHLVPLTQDDHLVLHHLTEKGLTLEDVRHLRELGRVPRADSEALGKQYGITGRTVRNYWTGFTWARLLGEEGPVEIAPRECASPLCTNKVHGRRHRLYCSPLCRSNTNRWKTGVRPTPSRFTKSAVGAPITEERVHDD